MPNTSMNCFKAQLNMLQNNSFYAPTMNINYF